MKKYLLPLFVAMAAPAHAHIECLEAKINDHYLVAGRTTTVTSKHHYVITNTTAVPQTYTHTFYLAPDDQNGEMRIKNFTLQPGEHRDFWAQVKTDVRYGKEGDRAVTAYTSISGPEMGTIYKKAYIFVR